MPKTANKSLKNVIIWRATKTRPEMNSQEYAALWGSSKGSGPCFYEVGHTSLNKLGWTAEDWLNFYRIIDVLIDDIRRNPERFEKNDVRDLAKLSRWAYRNACKLNTDPCKCWMDNSCGATCRHCRGLF